MYKRFFITLFFLIIAFKGNAQPQIIWQKCFGSSGDDAFGDVIRLKDKSYLATLSFEFNDGDFSDSPLPYSTCIMKIDTNFNIVWKKYFGSTGGGTGVTKLIQLQNNTYLCVGSTNATSGYSIENHGGDDIFLMKLDENGNKLWSHCYGSAGTETFRDIIQTHDGGFLITGSSNFSGGNIPSHYGSSASTDIILMKIDSNGIWQWTKVFGGTNYDLPAGEIVEQNPNQYRFDGGSSSKDYDLLNCGIDTLLVNWALVVDTSGKIIKHKFTSAYSDMLSWHTETKTGNNEITMIGAGNSHSKFDYTYPFHDKSEGTIAFYDTSLNLVKMKQWGGSGIDAFNYCIRDEKGYYYFLGNTASTNGDITTPIGGAEDYWILCTDENMNKLWGQTFGGTSRFGELPSGYDKIIIQNNLLVYFGHNISPKTLPDKDVDCGHLFDPNHDHNGDAWIVAFDLTTGTDSTTQGNYTIYPNPTTDKIYLKNSKATLKRETIMLTDMLGRTVKRVTVTDDYEQQIDIGNVADGMYIISVIKHKKIDFRTKLIIKQ
ncbi:MAG: hypothetical protein RJA07_2855 [Bacteroidota bacterium]|jgi:hypothetical protein